MLLTIVIFLIILLVLVLTHELGHFVFAKFNGVRVEEFAFGFPPRLFTFKKGETKYSFNLLPLGGFVKIQGEEGEDWEDPRSFSAKSFWSKILIVLAGVLFNLMLAYFLISSGFILGTPVALDEGDPNPSAQVRITDVQKNSPAEQTGLLAGDILVSISSDQETLEVKQITAVQEFISKNKGKALKIVLGRGRETIAREVLIRSEVPEGEGALGIAMVRLGAQKLSLWRAISQGFNTTAELTLLTAKALGLFFFQIFTGRASVQAISGPVGIVNLVGDFSRFGFLFLIQFTALLSINLALINLIPFPGLDGGRAFLLLLEKIRGAPLHWKLTRLIHSAGFVLLLLLMLVVTYYDIVKLNL